MLAAERRGISPELAERLVKDTLLGTALLLVEEESFAGLIKSVATKGGMTEAGAKVIQREGPRTFNQLFQVTQARHERVKKKIEGERDRNYYLYY